MLSSEETYCCCAAVVAVVVSIDTGRKLEIDPRLLMHWNSKRIDLLSIGLRWIGHRPGEPCDASSFEGVGVSCSEPHSFDGMEKWNWQS